MYVTIIADGDGAVAYGPHPTSDPAPAATAPGAQRLTARLCPPELLDRSTGIIGDPHAVAYLEPSTARTLTSIADQRARPGEADLVTAIVFHPGSRRAVALGPLTRTEATSWWSFRHNRFPQAGIRMAVLTLRGPTPADPSHAQTGAEKGPTAS